MILVVIIIIATPVNDYVQIEQEAYAVPIVAGEAGSLFGSYLSSYMVTQNPNISVNEAAEIQLRMAAEYQNLEAEEQIALTWLENRDTITDADIESAFTEATAEEIAEGKSIYQTVYADLKITAREMIEYLGIVTLVNSFINYCETIDISSYQNQVDYMTDTYSQFAYYSGYNADYFGMEGGEDSDFYSLLRTLGNVEVSGSDSLRLMTGSYAKYFIYNYIEFEYSGSNYRIFIQLYEYNTNVNSYDTYTDYSHYTTIDSNESLVKLQQYLNDSWTDIDSDTAITNPYEIQNLIDMINANLSLSLASDCGTDDISTMFINPCMEIFYSCTGTFGTYDYPLDDSGDSTIPILAPTGLGDPDASICVDYNPETEEYVISAATDITGDIILPGETSDASSIAGTVDLTLIEQELGQIVENTSPGTEIPTGNMPNFLNLLLMILINIFKFIVGFLALVIAIKDIPASNNLITNSILQAMIEWFHGTYDMGDGTTALVIPVFGLTLMEIISGFLIMMTIIRLFAILRSFITKRVVDFRFNENLDGSLNQKIEYWSTPRGRAEEEARIRHQISQMNSPIYQELRAAQAAASSRARTDFWETDDYRKEEKAKVDRDWRYQNSETRRDEVKVNIKKKEWREYENEVYNDMKEYRKNKN